jgi:phenylalanyl-tRNA synthetase alpha chain
MILDKIETLLKEVNNLSAKNVEDVEQLRRKYLSKKGEINSLMSDFRNVATDQKRSVGIKINELKKSRHGEDQQPPGPDGRGQCHE